jgi:hypothetical protein
VFDLTLLPPVRFKEIKNKKSAAIAGYAIGSGDIHHRLSFGFYRITSFHFHREFGLGN